MDYKKWPEGVGVDLEFWNNRDLWWLLDAAAIAMGIDPRVFRDKSTDPAHHGGPKLGFDSFPGLHTKINDFCIMAKNGLFPVLKDGVNDHVPMWWCIRPSDYRAFVEGRTATTPPTPATEPGHDQQVDGYARPLPGDKPEDYIQRLKDKGVHDDEIQYRVYEYRLPRWGFSQWKAHCRVNDIDYPPKGLKGDPDRDKYGKAYRDARDRHLARAGASEKSEFMPEKSEFMT